MFDQRSMLFDKILLRKNDQVYIATEACNFETSLRKNVDRLGFEAYFRDLP